MNTTNKEYFWEHNQADKSFNYLHKTIKYIIENKINNKGKLVDIGCGNGYLTKKISEQFQDITAIDNSETAIIQAKKNYTGKIEFLKTNLNDYKDVQKIDCITAIEVIEHIYSPDNFLKKIYEISNKETKIIISTPYHGFIKNLLVVLTGNFDNHFSPLWEHGHIKFFSKKTLQKLTYRNKFRIVETFFSGRFYPISKSIIIILEKIT